MRIPASVLSGCLLALGVATFASPVRSAEPRALVADGRFSAGERNALWSGSMVSRPLTFDAAGGHYVGGVSYQVVDARPEAVLAALSDVSNWPEALPQTLSAQAVEAKDGLARVELVQGSSFASARYSVVLERQDAGTIRFWMDEQRPHDIRDVWGYFRVTALPNGRSLITVGAALDLGDGIARALFEDKIARLVLRAPAQIRGFVEPRRLALLQK
jgi:hypothetical protein